MILDRWRLRSGLPAVDVPSPATPTRAPKHVTVHDVDGQRWASCTRCAWTSEGARELDAQVVHHQGVSCGLIAR